MLKKIFENLKPRYSYNILMILSFFNFCTIVFSYIYFAKQGEGLLGATFYTAFIANPLELIFLVFAILIGAFEFHLKKWRISQNIYNLKILKIVRFFGFLLILFFILLDFLSELIKFIHLFSKLFS